VHQDSIAVSIEPRWINRLFGKIMQHSSARSLPSSGKRPNEPHRAPTIMCMPVIAALAVIWLGH
jgi:hypothetical protein